ncbi:MAG: putative Ig domain-containing protein [Rhodospirillaceae bacterium]|nr:putative Ig domain-containing protein [Rhodospirillaceae bacterium]
MTDADGDTATFTFNWAVVADDLTPSFGSATIASQSWVTGKDITAFAAPAASGGNAPLMHGVAGLLAGVVMLNSMQIQGTPTAAGSGTATVAARDADGDLAKVSFNWTVTANAQPSFGTSTVSSQSWTAGQPITALTVPSATGGNGTLSYGAAGLPDGIALSPTLELSGRPLATGSGTATVTARDIDGDTATLNFGWTVASPNPANTGTVLSVIPDATTSGAYTVKGMYSGTREYVWWTLYEESSHGHSEEYSVSSGSFMQRFVNRTNGTYTYRLEGCYFAPHPRYPDEDAEVCENVGAALTVTVNEPNPDSVGTQLADTYEARVGRMGTNGPKGLYIKRTSTAIGAGLFQDVILKRTGNAFELVAAPPGSTNATTGASWPVTTAADLVLNDINLDGFVDILVRGVAGAIGVTGALDQIVYAPGHRGGTLGTLRAVDSPLKNFLAEVSSWTQNPMYFQQNEVSVEALITVERENCFIGESKRFCVSIPIPVLKVTGTRPTNKSSEAREFAKQFSIEDGLINPELILGSIRARVIDEIFKRIFGTQVLGGILNRGCAGTHPYDSQTTIPCNNSTVIGEVIVWQNANVSTATGAGDWRHLTTGEKQLASREGLAINNVDDVRVHRRGFRVLGLPQFELSGQVTAPNGHIYIGPNNRVGPMGKTMPWRDDYAPAGSAIAAQLDDQATLIHELVHVWQNRNQHCSMVCMIVRRGLASIQTSEPYVYWPTLSAQQSLPEAQQKKFGTYNIEQQAEMVSDRFLLENSGRPKQPNNANATTAALDGAIPFARNP